MGFCWQSKRAVVRPKCKYTCVIHSENLECKIWTAIWTANKTAFSEFLPNFFTTKFQGQGFCSLAKMLHLSKLTSVSH